MPAIGRIDGLELGRIIDDFSAGTKHAVKQENGVRRLADAGQLWHFRIGIIGRCILLFKVNVHVKTEKAVRSCASAVEGGEVAAGQLRAGTGINFSNRARKWNDV